MRRSTRSVDSGIWRDPEVVFRRLFQHADHVVWLDAGRDAETGKSYLAEASDSSILLTASVTDGTVTTSRPVDPGARSSRRTGAVLTELARSIPGHDASAPADGGFQLGWLGWLGYELAAQTMGAPVAESRTPDAALLSVDRALVFDHAQRRIRLLVSPEADADGWVDQMLERLRALPTGSPLLPFGQAQVTGTAVWRHTPARYAELIKECQSAIARGDAYQLCLTNEILVQTEADPVEAYLRLRATSPSHHGGFVRFGDRALLSSSPEQFLQIGADRVATTKPIKGTRPRSTDLLRDAGLAAELLASEKERAENLMIVDLMRNDLSRVAKLGSVSVPSLLAVETYAQVHQLVSTVRAELADGIGPLDALGACFPAGSMTGAPKLSAVRILHELEGGPRGVYSGAFGYIGMDGAVDLAMVIRSIVFDGDTVSIGTGGGITALSDPEAEIDETRVKVSALLAVLGVTSTYAATE